MSWGPEEFVLLWMFVGMGGFCAFIVLRSALRRRKRNRLINLPPPDSRCRRNGTEAVP